jgi:hypothetical protein
VASTPYSNRVFVNEAKVLTVKSWEREQWCHGASRRPTSMSKLRRNYFINFPEGEGYRTLRIYSRSIRQTWHQKQRPSYGILFSVFFQKLIGEEDWEASNFILSLSNIELKRIFVSGYSCSPNSPVMEDMLYVAMGDSVKKNKSILIWSLQNSGGKKMCIIHINQPATVIPMSKLATYNDIHVC